MERSLKEQRFTRNNFYCFFEKIVIIVEIKLMR